MAKLTQRQNQIVRLLVEGQSQKEAAKALGLSPGAVRAQVYKARMRASVQSTAQLVYRAHDELAEIDSNLIEK